MFDAFYYLFSHFSVAYPVAFVLIDSTIFTHGVLHRVVTVPQLYTHGAILSSVGATILSSLKIGFTKPR